MPYEWQPQTADGTRSLRLWRYRSLTPRGFAWVIGAAAVAMLMPLMAVVGTAAMWGLLPFAAIAMWALWSGVQFGWREGGTQEHLTLTRDLVVVVRHDPGRPDRAWQANPYWVRVSIRSDGPVDEYLTLSDGQRVIELGVFLGAEERLALRDILNAALDEMRAPPRV